MEPEIWLHIGRVHRSSQIICAAEASDRQTICYRRSGQPVPLGNFGSAEHYKRV
jgi:hypothetical protein